ncbi:MAG TPA: LamG-like jellyroll fold domain-containing protein [Nitrospiria bacterium]|nr:LamG-like jellyroll fold domain-containing protein [Nitrospiria bacterium]
MLALLLSSAGDGWAATRTWTGGGTDNNWSTAANWGGTAPVSGDTVVFPGGAAQLSNNNDIAGATFIITISGSGYTLSGNAVTLGGNLTDSTASGSNTINLPITLSANRTVTVTNAAETLTISGTISEAGGARNLIKAGNGILILSGTNSYTGTTTISGGTLRLAGGNAITDTATVSLANTAGVLLDLNGTSETIGSLTGGGVNGGNISLGAGTLTLGGVVAGTATYAGIISGTGGLVKKGAATAIEVLTGVNSYTGTTMVNAGTLRLGVANAIASSSAVIMANVAGAALNLTANQTISSLSGGGATGGNVTLVANTLTVGDATSTTYSGVISGGGKIIKQGTGTLSLTAVNTYSGTTTISAGTLSANSSSALGSGTASNTLIFTGGTLQAAGTITSPAARGVTLTATGVIDTNGQTVSLAGVISGAGGLTKNGVGTLTLAGTAANTYSGTTTVNGGELDLSKTAGLNAVPGALVIGDGTGSDTVKLINANQIADAAAVTIASSGVLDLNGRTETIGSLGDGSPAGGAVTSGAAGAITLTTGGNNGSTTFSGVISDGSGTVALVKQGTGTWTVAGNNGYSGATLISQGILTAAANNALGSNLGATTVSSGASLSFSGGITYSTAETVTINGAGAAGTAGAINNSSGTNSFAGPIVLAIPSTIGSSAGSLTLGGGITGAGMDLTLGGAGGGVVGGVIGTTTGTVTKTGTGTWTLAGNNTYSGATSINQGTLQLGAAGDGTDGPLGTITGNTTVAGGATLDANGVTLSTAEPLTLNGTGVGANGALVNGSGTAATYGGPVTLGSNSSLGGSGDLTVAGVIGGAFNLTKVGANALTLSNGNNSYTGMTTVGAGTLKLGAAGSPPNSPLGTTAGGTVVSSGATLDLNGMTLATAEPLTLNGAGVGANGALVNGSGTAATYSGPVTLASTAAAGGAGDMTLSGVMTGAGGLTKVGAGTVTLSNAGNSYAGATSMLAGNLLVAAAAPSSGNGALGNSAGGAILVGDTAAGNANVALLTNGAYTIGRPITVRAGNSGTAAIGGNTADPSTFSGAVSLNKDVILQAAAGGSVAFSNTITGAFAVTKAGAGAVQLSGAMTVGSLSLTGGTFGLGPAAHTISGTVSVAASTTLDGGSGSVSVGGGWVNNGAFTAGTGTVILNGTALQTLTGAMTGPAAFDNLTITNASGADDPGCNVSFTPGVIFASPADVTGNYTIITGHVRVQYLAGATYNVGNVNWNGQSASTRIFFRSTAPSQTWFLKVTGSQAVDYVNVTDSTAIVTGGGQVITAVNSVIDPASDSCANNANWQFTLDLPVVASVAPTSALPGTTTLSLTLTGANFQSGATVAILAYNGSAWVNDPNITGAGSCANNGTTPTTEIDCTISIPTGTPIGYRQMIVTNPDGGASLPANFYVGSLVATPMVAYGVSGSSEPKYRLLQANGSWTAEAGVGANSGEPRWTVLRASPISPEKTLGVIDVNRALSLLVWNGAAWGPPLTATTSTGPIGAIPSPRSVDIAYEGLSGEALAVYGLTGSALPHYRVWNGSAWSAESVPTVSLNTTSPILWVRLVPRPGSNEIVLLYEDASGAINALVWDGVTNTFGHEQLLTMNGSSIQAQVFDGAYTEDSCTKGLPACQAVIVWADSSSSTPDFRTWDGTTWGASQSLPIGLTAAAGGVRTVRLAADHSTDRMAAGVVSNVGQLSVSIWDGSAWATTGNAAPQVVGAVPSLNATQARPFDLAWQGFGGTLFVDAEGAVSQWRTWTPIAGWSAPAVLPPTTALKGQWHLEETGPLLDSSGNGNNLTLTANGTTAGQPGIVGNGVLFTGGSASTAANPASLNLSGSALTMEAWVYPQAFPSSAIIVNKESAYQMGINKGVLQAAVMTRGTSCSWSWQGSTSLSLNAWQHVAVTFDGTLGQMKFYVNGALKQTVTYTGTMTGCGSKNALMIGARPSGSYFQGLIDEVSVLAAVQPPLAQAQFAANPISQDVLLGRLSEIPDVTSALWVVNGWQPLVTLTGSASGAQTIPLSATLYPASFSMVYDQHLQPPPLSLSSVTPGVGYQTASDLPLVMTGTHFVCPGDVYPCAVSSNSTQVQFLIGFAPDPTVAVTSGTVDSLNQMTVHIAIDPASPPGSRNIQLTNPGNQSYVTPVSLFQVSQSPTVTSTTCPSGGAPPCHLGQGALNQDVFINGAGFDNTSVVTFTGGSNITLNTTTLISSSQLKVNLTLSAGGSPATAGTWDVTVTDGGGQIDSGASGDGAFIVDNGPVVSGVSPGTGGPGTFSMTVNGSNFQNGATLAFSGSGMTASGCTYAGVPASFTCTVTIDPSAEVGYRSATVTNPNPPGGNAGVGTTSSVFGVTGTPTVTSTTSAAAPSCAIASPTVCQLGQGATNYQVTVNGTNFSNVAPGPAVTFINAGSPGSVTATSVVYVNSTRLVATVTVAANASAGPWDVMVTNSGGLNGSGTGLLQVTPKPTITSISPPSLQAGSGGLLVDVYGANFELSTPVYNLLTLGGFTLSDPTQITAGPSTVGLIPYGGVPLAPDSSTVALWHLDENGQTSAADSSGNGNTGVYGIGLPDPADIASGTGTFMTGGVAATESQTQRVVKLPSGAYRLYYAQQSNGAYWALYYKDTIDTNPPNASNVPAGSGTFLNSGTAANDQASAAEIVPLPSGAYRLYYSRYTTFWALYYKDTTDTNPPSATNIPAGAGTSLNTGSGAADQAFVPRIVQLPGGNYRLYYGRYNGTYWSLYYKDTSDTNPPGSANIGAGVGIFLNSGTANNDQATGPDVVPNPNGSYRLYYSRNNGTYNALYYKDTSDTNPPNASNIPTGPGTFLNTGTAAASQALYPYSDQLPGGAYRLYFGNNSSGFYGLYYKDTVDVPSQTTAAHVGTAALSFDGVADDLNTADAPFDFDRTAPFTLEAWILTSSTGGRIFSKMSNASPYTGYELYVDGSGVLHAALISTWTTNVAEVLGSVVVNDGLWHHVAVTYDGSSTAGGLKLYVDGTLDPSITILKNTLSASILNNVNLHLGSRNGQAYYFNGLIDEAAVSDTALNASTILSQYNQTLGAYSATTETATSPAQPANGVTSWTSLQVTAAGSNCSGCTAYVRYATSMDGTDPIGSLPAAGAPCTTGPLTDAVNCYPITGAGLTSIDLSQVQVSGVLTNNLIRVRIDLQGDGALGKSVTVTGLNLSTVSPTGPVVGFSGAGIAPNPVTTTFIDATHVQMTVDVASTAPVGSRTMTLTNSDGGSAAFTFQVDPPSPNDDAQQITGTGAVSLFNATAVFGSTSSDSNYIGYRIAQVNVPQGATIQHAYLKVYLSSLSTVASATYQLHGQNADTAAPFAATANNISGRITCAGCATTSVVSSPIYLLANGYRVFDVTSIVQEIVNRPGWASGNAIAFIFHAPGFPTVGTFSMAESANPPGFDLLFNNVGYGPFNPTHSGTGDFTNPDNGWTSDNLYATASGMPHSQIYDSFTIPDMTAKAIAGILVQVEAKSNSNAVRSEATVALSWDGGTSWTADKRAFQLDGTDRVFSYGGADGWGHTFLPSELNGTCGGSGSCFKVRITKNYGSTSIAYTMSLDAVSVNVFTTANLSETQSAYRWFSNVDNPPPATVGPLLLTASGAPAAQNGPAVAPAINTPFRLRLLLTVGGSTLPVSGQSFKLQVAQQGSDNSCDTGFVGESYADVTSVSGKIRFYSNSNLSDGDPVASDPNDPTNGSNVLENYLQSNTYFSNNQAAIPAGSDGLWDAALVVDSSAPAGSTYCFRVVNADGSLLPFYTQIPQITTTPALTQAAYRWFANTNGTNVSTPLGPQDTAGVSSPRQGTPFRLRLLLYVSGGPLAISGQSFKLQIAQQGADASCDAGFVGETYTDVSTTTGAIRFVGNPGPADGDPVTPNSGIDPQDPPPPATANPTVAENYLESNADFNNSQAAIPAGEDGLWDVVLEDVSSVPGTTYCFRVVKSDGRPLDSYNILPSITTTGVKFTALIDDNAAQRSASPYAVTTTAATAVFGTGAANNTYIGYRRTNVTVPQAATIQHAYLKVYLSAINATTTTLQLNGEASDNSAPFAATNGDLCNDPVTPNCTNRPWTTASVSQAVNDLSNNYYYFDVTAIVQEIVNRPGWATGNAMDFMIHGPTLGNVATFNFKTSTFPAELSIIYNDSADAVRSPTVSVAGGYTNPNNAFASDDAYATTTNSTNAHEDYGSFNFSGLTNQVIDGILVQAEAHVSSTAALAQYTVQLSWDGGTSWTTAKAAFQQDTTDRVESYGGADGWSHAFVPTELTGTCGVVSCFQVRIQNSFASGTNDAFVDHVTAQVFYHTPGGAGPDAVSYTNVTESALNNLGGRTGQQIRVIGANFGSVTLGSGNGANCAGGAGTGCIQIGGDTIPDDGSITTWTSDTIVFTIPSGISVYGTALTVVSSGAADGSPLNFKVYPQITSLCITSLCPATTTGAMEGDSLTINGFRFGSAQGSQGVYFNDGTANRAAAVTSWSDTAITVTVPSEILDTVNSVTLYVYQGTGGDNSLFAQSPGFDILPQITSITTYNGSGPPVQNAAREYAATDADGIIVLSGDHFGASGTVTILGSTATQSAQSPTCSPAYQSTCIRLQVPTGIPNDLYAGNIIVTRAGGDIAAFSGFRILPRIVSLTPNAGPSGSSVTVTGDHLCEPNPPFDCTVAANWNTPDDGNDLLWGVGNDGTVTSITVPPSGSNNNYQIVVTAPSLAAGSYPVFVRSANFDSNSLPFSAQSPTTTLGDGTDPASYTVGPCPSPCSTFQMLDQFTFATVPTTSKVTSLTVTTTNSAAIASMKITDNAMVTQYFTTLTAPDSGSANTWTFSGGTPIPPTTTPAAFRVLVTINPDSALTSTFGNDLIPVTGSVTTYASTSDFPSPGSPDVQAGADAAGTTVTVDNLAPADAVWGTITPGDGQVVLNWTNPADADFSQAVIVRDTASLSGKSLADGSTYTAGQHPFGGTDTVVYVNNGTTFTDSGLTNGTGYYYKIFSKDAYGNYAAGVQTSQQIPGAKQITCTGGGPLASIASDFTLSADTTCSGDLTIAGGAILTLNGDPSVTTSGQPSITLTVTGTLHLTGTDTGPPSQIVLNPANTFGHIVATDFTIDPGGVVHANGLGCGSSQSFNVASGFGCADKGTGTTAGYGEGADFSSSSGGGGGGGYGGAGGQGGSPTAGAGGPGGFVYGDNNLTTIMLGSGGGNNATYSPTALGGAGGGAVEIDTTGTLTINGTISANGANGAQGTGTPSLGPIYNGGGGSGGSVEMNVHNIAGQGQVQANGGNGGAADTVTDPLFGDNYGGGGGGGRVLINIDFSGTNSFIGAVEALGGASGGNGTNHHPGLPGAVGSVTVNGPAGACSFTFPSTSVISRDLTCAGDLTISNGATVVLNGDPAVTDPAAPSRTLIVNGDVKVCDDTANPPDCTVTKGLGTKFVINSANTFVRIIVGGNVTVGPGAVMSADGGGFGATQGPGAGVSTTTGNFSGGGGGGYGGTGGDRNLQPGGGGPAYGDPELSTAYPGSGGGNSLDPVRGTALGGSGGGAVDLCLGTFTTGCAGSGVLTLNGTLSANGLQGNKNTSSGYGGGGSGGGLKITAGTLTGNGLLQANGGSGGAPYTGKFLVGFGGGGAGGRIYVQTGSLSFPTAVDNLQSWGGLSNSSPLYQGFPGLAGSVLLVAGASPPTVIVSGGGTLDDVLDGSNDGTQTYAALTVLGAAGSDGRTFGTWTVSTNLHVAGAFNAGAGLIINGTMTADDAVTVTGGLTSINGPLIAPTSLVNVAGSGNPSLRINGDVDSIVSSLTVGNGTAGSGAVLLAAAGTTPGHVYSHLTAATSVTINAGGSINGNGLGCGPSLGFNITTGSGCTSSTTDGPGQGADCSSYCGASGGGYGGAGGKGTAASGGLSYGSATLTPMMLGSGGGTNPSTPPAKLGGSGGGSILLDVPNALTVNGTLSVNGMNGSVDPVYPEASGGGSGGSLYINAGALTGAGMVQANGGYGAGASTSDFSGGGGGGRIYINSGTIGSSLVISALPGTGSQVPSGIAGTVITTGSPDIIPPASATVTAALVPIVAGVNYSDRAQLSWTAVGDDGMAGTATSYALGYSTLPISTPVTDTIFNGLKQVSGLPVPQPSGSPESFTVTGLASNQTYNFVLKVCDEVPNCSYSNVAPVTLPPDTIPPAAVSDLTTGTVTSSSVVLQWTSPGDDSEPAIDPPCPCGTPKYYIVKYSTSPITGANFGGATTFDAMTVPKGDGTSATIVVTGGYLPHAAGLGEALTVTGLSQNTAYYFAIEAVDEVGNQSPFGVVVTATTQGVTDTTLPGQITNLQVVSVTDRSAQLKWTAQGDDGPAGGPATSYDLRYSPFEIIPGSAGDCVSTIGFDQTTCANGAQVSDLLHQVTTGVPIPGQPGAVQSMTVNMCETLNGGGECVGSFQHATSNTNYFFAIRVTDKVGNLSTLGTLTTTNVNDPIDPACDGSGTSQNCNLRTDMRVDPVYAVLVSVPLQGPLSPTAIFGPLDGVPNWCGSNDLPCLYKWISTGLTETDGSYQLMDPDPCSANCVEPGEGYYFFTNTLSLLNYSGTNVTGVIDGHLGGVPHFDDALQEGMNLIGNPFKKNVQLQDTHILQTGGGSCTLGEMTFAQAVAAGVVGNAVYVWTGAAEVPVTYNASPPALLQPWQGYELFVTDATCAYQLLIPQPN